MAEQCREAGGMPGRVGCADLILIEDAWCVFPRVRKAPVSIKERGVLL